MIDIYVSPSSEDLGGVASRVERVLKNAHIPSNLVISERGSVEGMRRSFTSFGIGLILSIVLVYLILMAQFSSFIDPLIILLAIPPGITGVILFPAGDGNHTERDVADGRDHDDWNRGLEFDSYR